MKCCKDTQETAAQLAGKPSDSSATPSVAVQSGKNNQQIHTGSSDQVAIPPAFQSDNGHYWVVTCGEHPGVYLGKYVLSLHLK